MTYSAAPQRSVTCIDWSIRTGQILSASEDCTYAVWDAFGQRMFASVVHSHVITSVAWAPNGENFAVGSFNTLKYVRVFVCQLMTRDFIYC